SCSRGKREIIPCFACFPSSSWRCRHAARPCPSQTPSTTLRCSSACRSRRSPRRRRKKPMSVEDRLELPSYLHHTEAVSARFAEIRKQPIVMSLSAVSRQFEGSQGPVLALSKVSFDVRRREFISVIGPSGCGKSTLIRIVAGLETCTGGSITIDGKEVGEP